MDNSGIVIKGNREGLNVLVDIDKFSGFREMFTVLREKLSKGKKFYKDSTLYITINTEAINQKQMDKLRNVLLEEIEVKEIIIEDKIQADKQTKMFNGIYEGRTKFLRKTVRGGQCVNFPGNIVIIGDVNSGAEIYAGGNIIVLGSIKGNVFAGTSGNQKAIIAAFSLQPEVLKIADMLTISPDDCEKPQYPEVAKIKDGVIMVEPYLTNKYIY